MYCLTNRTFLEYSENRYYVNVSIVLYIDLEVN